MEYRDTSIAEKLRVDRYTVEMWASELLFKVTAGRYLSPSKKYSDIHITAFSREDMVK